MKKLFNILSSLRLAIILLALGMVLVFLGTLDQVEFGIYEVQRKYFNSFFVLWGLPQNLPAAQSFKWFVLPLPGGLTIGLLLLANLACAHFRYFVLSWRKLGITIIHGGIILLILSGFLSSLLQVEGQMMLSDGKSTHYMENIRSNELVIIDKSDPQWDEVHSVPVSLLKKKQSISIKNTPFSIQAIDYYPNAQIALSAQNPNAPKTKATQGAGIKMGLSVFPQAVTYKENDVNTVTAYVQVKADDEDIGIWLVSNIIDEKFPPQKFEYEGKQYEIALRFKRTYFPFGLRLMKFTHDRYPGTDIPRNFSSLVDIVKEGKTDRQVLIYMNHPLRHEGYTFYQASFGDAGMSSILQVVSNPMYVLPYIAVAVVGFGLAFHFIFSLAIHLKKRRSRET